MNNQYTLFKKYKNDIYLSEEAIEILDEYNIKYQNCNSLRELIFLVSQKFNECGDDVLDNLLDILCENNYFQNFNK